MPGNTPLPDSLPDSLSDSLSDSSSDELRSVARSMLARGGRFATVGWRDLAGLGWLGLEVPEALGGAGATFAETAVVLEELGRQAAASGPYVGSAVLGAGLLAMLEPGGLRDRLLAGTASGERRLAVALPAGDPDVPLPFRFQDGRVSGEAQFVPDAPDADELLLVADASGTPVVVHLSAADVTIVAQPLLDTTRRFGTVAVAGRGVSSVLRFAGDPHVAVARVLDRGSLAVACDSQGLAEAMVEATVGYVKVRHQFGRPIGSFQAVKHACADLLVSVTIGRELLDSAVRRVANDDGDDDPGPAVSMAKAQICEDAVAAVGKAMQLHGGIGYTWESGVHAYLKRAALNRALFGSPSWHRRRLARRYG